MATSYDRRTAAEPAKIIELTEKAREDFQKGVALIESAYKTVREVKILAANSMGEARGWMSPPAKGPDYRTVFDYARNLVDEIDTMKILQKSWMLRWFDEFVSETKASLKG